MWLIFLHMAYLMASIHEKDKYFACRLIIMDEDTKFY